MNTKCLITHIPCEPALGYNAHKRLGRLSKIMIFVLSHLTYLGLNCKIEWIQEENTVIFITLTWKQNTKVKSPLRSDGG